MCRAPFGHRAKRCFGSRNAHERHHHAEDGRHDAHQRNARGLHGEEFEVFAHVAEGDERGQQDGQGQGGGHEGDAHVPEELPQDVEGEPFADQIVDPTPGELHHEDEQTNEESPHKELQELAQDEGIETFDFDHRRRIAAVAAVHH